MKASLLLWSLLTLPVLTWAQATETPRPEYLQAPDDWRKEYIPFPLGFAPELKYSGAEDIRFAPGWSSVESPDFWTYKFIWYLDADPQLDGEQLQADIETYFDGLMNAVAKDGDQDALPLPGTAAAFVPNAAPGRWKGRVRVYDAFFQKKLISLNMLVHTFYCPGVGKYVTVFDVSPQPYAHVVWNTMAGIGLGFQCAGR